MSLKEQYEQKMREMYQRSQGDGEKRDNYGIVCPTYYGKKCKVCDYCKEILFDKAKYDGTPLQQAARDKNIKHHFYSNIVFTADTNEIVVLDYGLVVHDKLLGYQMDPMSQFKFFFDHETGRNLYIVKTPGATPRQTKYDVEPIIKSTPFPNMRLLAKLESPEHQLHNIVDNIKSEKVKVVRQNKLPMQRTEVRFLPSWLGPDSFVFSHHVMYHFGLSEDEFNAVQEGKLDPFADVRKDLGYIDPSVPEKAAKEELKTPMIAELHAGGEEAKYKPRSTPTEKSGWGAFGDLKPDFQGGIEAVKRQQERKTAQPEPGRPKCFGTFDANNTECTEECMEDGWGKPCAAVKEAESQVEKRRKASKAL